MSEREKLTREGEAEPDACVRSSKERQQLRVNTRHARDLLWQRLEEPLRPELICIVAPYVLRAIQKPNRDRDDITLLDLDLVQLAPELVLYGLGERNHVVCCSFAGRLRDGGVKTEGLTDWRIQNRKIAHFLVIQRTEFTIRSSKVFNLFLIESLPVRSFKVKTRANDNTCVLTRTGDYPPCEGEPKSLSQNWCVDQP